MKITAMPDLPASNTIPSNNQTHTSESLAPSAPAVPEAPKVEDERFSSKYAELAKREKISRSKIQTREAALKQREEALKAREGEYGTHYIRKDQIPGMFQKDSMQALRELGLSGDQLTQALLNQPSPQDQMIQSLQAEVAKIKEGQDQTKNMISENDNRAREQAIAQMRVDVKNIISTDPEFDTIKNTGSEGEVVEYIVNKFDQEGVIYSIEDAARAVEKELNEELFKYAQLSKIQALLNAQKPPAAPGVKPQKLQQNSPLKTLASTQVTSSSRPLSARDRAIALLEGNQI